METRGSKSTTASANASSRSTRRCSASAAARRATCGWSAATCRASTPRSCRPNGDWILRDKGSRYGTYVNGEAITEHKLTHGDRVQFGRASGADVVFLTGDGPAHTDRSHASAVNDLRQLAALLEGLRALGSGRVLDDVLALVLDAAIDVAGAERGFIMLRRAPTTSWT